MQFLFLHEFVLEDLMALEYNFLLISWCKIWRLCFNSAIACLLIFILNSWTHITKSRMATYWEYQRKDSCAEKEVTIVGLDSFWDPSTSKNLSEVIHTIFCHWSFNKICIHVFLKVYSKDSAAFFMLLICISNTSLVT